MGTIKKKKSEKKRPKPEEDNFCCVKEDITEIMLVAEKFATHVNKIETKLKERMQKLEIKISTLSREINELKKI